MYAGVKIFHCSGLIYILKDCIRCVCETQMPLVKIISRKAILRMNAMVKVKNSKQNCHLNVFNDLSSITSINSSFMPQTN